MDTDLDERAPDDYMELEDIQTIDLNHTETSPKTRTPAAGAVTGTQDRTPATGAVTGTQDRTPATGAVTGTRDRTPTELRLILAVCVMGALTLLLSAVVLFFLLHPRSYETSAADNMLNGTACTTEMCVASDVCRPATGDSGPRCTPGYCDNHAECVSGADGVKCNCRPGYIGERCQIVARDCLSYLKNGYTDSGTYNLTLNTPTGIRPVMVYCDMDSEGGGWTMLLRRQDGSVNFRRNWVECKEGFGDTNGEFWIGNDVIHSLTVGNALMYKLRIHLITFTNETRLAYYSIFLVGPESTNYRLTVSGYSGNAGNSFGKSNNSPFSTGDRDNDAAEDKHCAGVHYGPWWFTDRRCTSCLLTGLYGENVGAAQGIYWEHVFGRVDKFMAYADMQIRPAVV